MDDFLHNLRTGKNKAYDRKRRTYENPHSRMQERQGNRKSKPFHQNRDLSNESLTAIRKALDEISGNQKRLAEINTQRVAVEERKAEALESIVSYLKSHYRPAAGPPAAPAAPAPKAPESVAPAAKPETKVRVLNRDEIIERIKTHRAKGMSYEKVALKLEEEGVQTLSGRGRWRGQTIYRLSQEG